MSEPYYAEPSRYTNSESQPIFGASFGTALKRYYGKYATFKGRASRSEYWWTQLFLGVISFVLYIPVLPWYLNFVSSSVGFDSYKTVNKTLPEMAPLTSIMFIVVAIFVLAHFIPNIAILVRRLHDANLSGGYIFMSLIPFAGGFIVFILTLLPSKAEGARFD